MYPQEILNKFRALAPLRVLFTNPRSNEVDTLRNDHPKNLATGWIHHVNRVISPVHDVLLSSGKKQRVFKEEEYEKHEGPNWGEPYP